MDLLRFSTAGSVDDGKSTLIGRLLFDTKTIFLDQLDAVKKTSLKKGEESINLALITDGLKAEREQGITIDVAYRYFATPKRKFILADTPGHIQYTRNMVTGASNSNLSIILVDARNGIMEQTRRHTFIASLLGIDHIIVCINKMDIVNFDQDTYQKIKEDYLSFFCKLDVSDIRFIPISAKLGDNVVTRSVNMPWYQGPTLLYALENVYVISDYDRVNPRFPVQYIIRPEKDEFHDYRGYAGRVAGGIFTKGDEVVVYPSGFITKIKQLDYLGKEVNEIYSPMSATMLLEDDIDISRGDMIVKTPGQPNISQDIDLTICWMSDTPLVNGGKYILRQTTREVKCVIKNIHYKVDINSLDKLEEDKMIGLNDIARISLHTSAPLFFDSYKKNKNTGSIILIDEKTNNTVGAGMVL